MRFKDRVVLVTGGGRGIGQAIALGFAREGASVVVNAAHQATADETATLIRKAGGKAIAIEANVADEAQVNAMIDRVVHELGGLDVLVNNAGVSQPIVPTLEQDTADWDRVMATNLRSAYLCSKAAGKYMVPRHSGKIVNIASITGLTGQPMRTAYAPSKAAMLNLTKAMAVEWGPYNINVNAVAPGYVLTDLVRTFISQGKVNEEAMLKRTPLGRFSAPEDIAEAVMFLASDAARNITGIHIPVDAGWSVNGWYM